jgi:class 3 adenylate cyclase
MSDPVVLAVQQPARQVLRVLLDTSITFGRDCDGFLMADGRASRRHARFDLGETITITDLGSSNGTWCNGAPVVGTMEVQVGDVVTIGATEIVVGASAGTAPISSAPALTELRPVGGPRSSILLVADEVSSSVNSVEGSRAAQAMVTAEGTFTIVFSDIESSTATATEIGDDSWIRVLDSHNQILRAAVAEFGGREIKSQGDGFMLSFASARRAVQFAIEAQRGIARHSEQHPDRAMRIRLGVHTGEALRSGDGDLFGRHVIIASRIADKAEGGQILVSGLVRELTAGKIDLRYGAAVEVELKGIGSQVVHSVDWTTDSVGEPS